MKRIKKYSLIFIMFITLLFISGCTPQSYTVEDGNFDKSMKVDLNSKTSLFYLIHDVAGKKIDSSNIDGNSFSFHNLSIKYKSFNTKKEGRFNVTFTTNDPNVKSFTKTIEVADISKPKINLKKKKIKVFTDEVDSIDYYKYFTYKDNNKYDELTCIIDNSEVKKEPGDYYCHIKVYDKTDNTANKKIKVTVKERPIEKNKQTDAEESNSQRSDANQNNQNQSNGNTKKELPKTSNGNSNSSSNSSQPSQSQQSTNTSPSSSHSTVNPVQYNRYFAGNSIDTYNSAYDYAESIMGSGKANGYQVMPDGNGFNVTFS